MSKSKTPSSRAPLVPKTVLRQLADLANVPAANRAFFFDDICMHVQTVRERVELVARWTAGTNAKNLWRDAIALYETLSALDKSESEIIEEILRGKGNFIFEKFSDDGIGGLRQTAYQLALLFSLLAGKPEPRFPHQAPMPRKQGKSPGGRRKGAVKPIFQNFVRGLRATVKAAGGGLTLEKNDPPSGTMILALQVLRPQLPSGFIPKALAGSTLRMLIDQVGELERAIDEFGEVLPHGSV